MKKTNIYFDCEFSGLHQKTTLISIAFVSECGRKFYSELTDYDTKQIDKWLSDNVISNLEYNNLLNNDQIISKGENIKTSKDFRLKCNKYILNLYLKKWLSSFGEIQMWSDCLAYDWVLFNEIFGGAFSVPKNVCYIPLDLCTLMYINDIDPDINREEFLGIEKNIHNKKHNAMHDAEIIKKCVEKILKI